jgi:glycosyltransferase involved in cell wall biosynthesis
MNKNMPKLSIQICTYNRANLITKAIDSVLSQTFQDFEILILDDASSDNTEEIIKPFLSDSRIRYIKNSQNLGITKNRNNGITLSSGEYIAVLDSDDYWIDNNKDYALVGTNMIIVDEANKELKKVCYPTKNFVIKKTLLIKNMFSHSSVMYRKNEIISLGSYDAKISIWEDYDLWLRIGLKYKFANLNIFATAYKKHSAQSNTGIIKVGLDTQKIIIERYKKMYTGYRVAKFINKLREKRNG